MHKTGARDHVLEMLFCDEEMPEIDGVQKQCTIASQSLENNVCGICTGVGASLCNPDGVGYDDLGYDGIGYDDLCYDGVGYDDLCHEGMGYDKVYCCGCYEEILPLESHVVRTDKAAAGVENVIGMQWETDRDSNDEAGQRASVDQRSVRKDKIMQVCANSMTAHRQDMKLEDSTHKLRARCIKKIEQTLYYSRLRNRGEKGVAFVNETSGINAVLMMEWLTRNQTEYFIAAGCDIISSVCLLQNARSMQVASLTQGAGETELEYQIQKSELYKTMAMCVFDTPNQYSEATIQYHHQLLQAFVADAYMAIDFSTFMEVYFAGQTGVQQTMTNSLFVFMKDSTAPRQLSMYENFVEIVLRESEDIEMQQDIFVDYTCLMAHAEGVAGADVAGRLDVTC